MKIILRIIYALILCLPSFFAKADHWTRKADFPGSNVDFDFYFSINGKGYVGCGKDTMGNITNYFWEYDPAIDTWTRKADFAGGARWTATGFSIGNKGYAGIGSSGSLLSDFWEYDPVSDTWTKMADFGGGARWVAASFTIGNFGYVGTGFGQSGASNDLWQYDPSTNTWAQKSSIPSAGVADASGFAIGTTGFIMGGCYNTNIWQYNSVTDSWKQDSSLPSNPRCDAATFTISCKGYWGTGEFGDDTYGADLWQYDTATNTWTAKAAFPGLTRDEPVSFSAGNKGYIGLGGKDGFAYGIYYHDFWEYTPDSLCPVSCNLAPPVISTGKNQFCAYDSSQICAPTGFSSYRWNYGDSVICIEAKQSGNYYVTVADSNGCTAQSDQLFISVYTVPFINLSDDIPPFCPYDSASICAAGGFVSYQWSTGGTGTCIVTKLPGNYYVTVTDSNGCSAQSNPVLITVYPAPVDSIIAAKNIFCANDSAQICALTGFVSYQWNANATGTGNCIEAKQAGDYYVTVTDNNGCTAESNHLAISIYPVPSVSIVVQGDTLSSFGAVSYQWYFNNNPISNATDAVYIAKQQGSYSVEITDTNGCTEISNPVSITGVNDLAEEENILLYPNPCSVASVQLSVCSELIGSDLAIYDDEGRSVFHSAISNQKSAITINDLPSGVYYLRISNDKVSVVRKLVKL